MTGVSIHLDDARAQAMFSRLREAVSNLTPAMDAIGQLIASSVRGNIAVGRDYTGSPFADLSAVTIARRRKDGRDAKPLRDTGRLMNSITHRATAEGVEVFSDVEYAAAQQFGNPGNRMFGKAPAPIPARRFFPIAGTGRVDLQADTIEDMMDIMGRHIARAAA